MSIQLRVSGLRIMRKFGRVESLRYVVAGLVLATCLVHLAGAQINFTNIQYSQSASLTPSIATAESQNSSDQNVLSYIGVADVGGSWGEPDVVGDLAGQVDAGQNDSLTSYTMSLQGSSEIEANVDGGPEGGPPYSLSATDTTSFKATFTPTAAEEFVLSGQDHGGGGSEDISFSANNSIVYQLDEGNTNYNNDNIPTWSVPLSFSWPLTVGTSYTLSLTATADVNTGPGEGEGEYGADAGWYLTASVPEPSALAMLFVTSWAALRRRGRAAIIR
jgi:hypothetical protein